MDIEKAMKNIESVLNKSNEALGIIYIVLLTNVLL